MLFSLLAARPSLGPSPHWKVGAGQSERSWLLGLRRAIWRDLDRPSVIRWLDGLRLYVYPGNEMCRGVYLTGLYEPNEFLWLSKALQPGMSVIDAGANMGLYTIYAAQKVGPSGTVVAIEPSRRECARLRANIELNRLQNVRVCEVAISDRSGGQELRVATEEKSGHNTLGCFGYDSVVAEGNERVTLRRLDDLVGEEGIRRVDLIKMDIEGAEFTALQGCTQTLMAFRPTLLLEVSDRSLRHQGHSSGEVLRFLNECGYQILAFDPETCLPIPTTSRPYFESENVLAVHAMSLWDGTK
jgi:FkbM family methyltransferase